MTIYSEDWCINDERCTAAVMGDIHNGSLDVPTTMSPAAIKREQDRIDFYNTYDVMTGVRIAATLGAFFGLMVILVVCKSKSKTEKALDDPKLAAAAVAEAEEEERQIAAVLEATAYEQLNPMRRPRKSLDTDSVSPRWMRNSPRFSSIGGYSSLMDPPVRNCKFACSVDEESPPEDSKGSDEFYVCYNSYLDVPGRRPSNITCSSSTSSYLERRGSSVLLGLPAIPAHKNRKRRQSSPLPEQYDFYYPIDIRVIQPTPGGSPGGSERALYDVIPPKAVPPRLAPLASISSCNSSLENDYPDLEVQSYGSDSVFHDLEHCADTDDEIDPFSTDSEDDGQRPCCSKSCQEGRSEYPLPTISDESTSTLVGADKDSSPAAIPLADSASPIDSVVIEHVWTQETLF